MSLKDTTLLTSVLYTPCSFYLLDLHLARLECGATYFYDSSPAELRVLRSDVERELYSAIRGLAHRSLKIRVLVSLIEHTITSPKTGSTNQSEQIASTGSKEEREEDVRSPYRVKTTTEQLHAGITHKSLLGPFYDLIHGPSAVAADSSSAPGALDAYTALKKWRMDDEEPEGVDTTRLVADAAWTLKLDTQSTDVHLASISALTQHKTTSREHYTQAIERCRTRYKERQDVVMYNAAGQVTETTIFNILIHVDGHWITPALECGLLPGVMRENLIAHGLVQEKIITLETFRKWISQKNEQVAEVFVCNAVRGVVAANVVL